MRNDGGSAMGARQLGPDEPVPYQGWFQLEYDRTRWIPCPPLFPGDADRRSWAEEYARKWWDASGQPHKRRHVAALARNLLAVQHSIEAGMSCHLALIHLPGPQGTPLPAGIGVWPAEGDRDQQLRTMTYADDPAPPPAHVDDFPTGKLGAGIRVRSEIQGSTGRIGAIAYAWRSEELRTALRLIAVTPDLARLAAVQPDLDELARGLEIVPI